MPRSISSSTHDGVRPPVRAFIRPLQARGRTVGVLRIARNEGLSASGAQIRVLDALSYYAALGLERVRLVADAERAQLLQEAHRAKDAVLASVSHDLRTPLTTIKGLAHEIAAGRRRSRGRHRGGSGPVDTLRRADARSVAHRDRRRRAQHPTERSGRLARRGGAAGVGAAGRAGAPRHDGHERSSAVRLIRLFGNAARDRQPDRQRGEVLAAAERRSTSRRRSRIPGSFSPSPTAGRASRVRSASGFSKRSIGGPDRGWARRTWAAPDLACRSPAGSRWRRRGGLDLEERPGGGSIFRFRVPAIPTAALDHFSKS